MNATSYSARINSLLHQSGASSLLIERLLGTVRHVSTSNKSGLIVGEKNDDGFLFKLRKRFTKASERLGNDAGACERTIPFHGTSNTFDKRTKRVYCLSQKVPSVRYSTLQRPTKFIETKEVVQFRNISLLSFVKGVVGFSPRNPKHGPVRESNTTEKPTKDAKNMDSDGKPTSQTAEEDSEKMMRIQSAMMDEHGNPVTEDKFVRTEWGVRIKDQARKVDPYSDVAVTVEKPFYTVKSLWGVKVKQFMTRDEAARENELTLSTVTSGATSWKDFNSDLLSRPKSDSVTTNRSTSLISSQDQQVKSMGGPSQYEKKSSSLSLAVGEPIQQSSRFEVSEKTTQARSDQVQTPNGHSSNIEEKKLSKHEIPSIHSTSGSVDKINDNPLTAVTPDDEISAWKDLALKSKRHMEELQASQSTAGKLPGIFLLPEPPEPKLDVKTIPPQRKEAQTARDESPASDTRPKIERKRILFGRKQPAIQNSKVDEANNKKLHTISTLSPHPVRLAARKRSANVPLKTFTPNLDKLLFAKGGLNKVSGSKSTTHIESNKKGPTVDENSIKSDSAGQVSQNAVGHADSKITESETVFTHVQTIHPDVTLHSNQDTGKSASSRNGASHLIQESSAVVSPKLGTVNVTSLDANIRIPIELNPDRETKTYELKNYSYLCPEDIKETRWWLK